MVNSLDFVTKETLIPYLHGIVDLFDARDIDPPNFEREVVRRLKSLENHSIGADAPLGARLLNTAMENLENGDKIRCIDKISSLINEEVNRRIIEFANTQPPSSPTLVNIVTTFNVGKIAELAKSCVVPIDDFEVGFQKSKTEITIVNMLALAAFEGENKVIEELLALNCNVNSSGEFRCRWSRKPPLFWAASSPKLTEQQKLETVGLLLKHKANPMKRLKTFSTINPGISPGEWAFTEMDFNHVPDSVLHLLLKSADPKQGLDVAPVGSMLDGLSVRQIQGPFCGKVDKVVAIAIFYGFKFETMDQERTKPFENVLKIYADIQPEEERLRKYLVEISDHEHPEKFPLAGLLPNPLIKLIQGYVSEEEGEYRKGVAFRCWARLESTLSQEVVSENSKSSSKCVVT